MKYLEKLIMNAMIGGLLVLLPVYLAVLLLFKAMQSVVNLVKPIAMLLPAAWPAEDVLSLLLIFAVCVIIGAAIRTRAGSSVRERVEKSVLERIPGYAPLRGMTQQWFGEGGENEWKPALVEIEDALVPAFIIEQHDDGRLTVFVPSVPTPLAGAVYILSRERVHPVDVPFTQAIKSVSRWGAGSKDLVTAMRPGRESIRPGAL